MSTPVPPLLARFAELVGVPRVSLGAAPTPVARIAALGRDLWIKRDDLSADPLGGNKVRALEFLLGEVRPGDEIVTVGSAGSTHALSVATYGARLGARVYVGRWRQEMNAVAERVALRIDAIAERAPVFGTPVGAYLWSAARRVRGAHWIAAGGSTPLGVLGHVNAGLELVAQIDAGEMPEPEFIVVPLGTGGTAAGIALAMAIAGKRTVVIGARVVPRIVARERHVRTLANATARLIERVSGQRVPRLARPAIRIAHETFGGAYGRETSAGREAAHRLRDAAAVTLDATYSAKAFAHALALTGRGPTLFWLTFDSRALDDK